jgi:membrane associated rhomboid family serine protease
LFALRDSAGPARLPLATGVLVAANVIAYLLAVEHGGSIVDGPSSQTLVTYGAIPYEFAHLSSHCALGAAGFAQAVLCTGQAGVAGTAAAQPPTWETAFTSLFIHANVLALVLNMSFLGVFAATLEGVLGALRLALLYLLGGLVALGVAVAASSDSVAPLVGSSGALAAVLSAYVLLQPNARVLAILGAPMPRTREIPAWGLFALWLVVEVVLAAAHVVTPVGGGSSLVIDSLVGGVAFGLLAARLLARGGPPRRPGRAS